MKKAPLVSIIIPCYNHARFVAEAIESALGQTHSPVEVIVVDDGSTDDSVRVISGFSDRVLFLQQENLGPSVARNTGFRVSKGEFIAFLDADDLYEKNFIARLLAVFEQDPECVAVYCTTRSISEDGQWIPPENRFLFPAPEELYSQLLLHQFILMQFTLTRRTGYEKAGLFDPQFRNAEDWEMLLRIARIGKIVGVPEPLTRRRVVPGSLSRGIDTRKRHDLCLTVLRKHFGVDESIPERLSPLQRLAYGHHYLSTAAYYLGGGENRMRAHGLLQRAFTLSPDLIHRLSTYFGLFLEEEDPVRDGLGIIDTPDALARFLAGVFDAPDTPAEVKGHRDEAMAHLDVTLGLICYKTGDPLAACRFFLSALTRYPHYALIREPALPPYPSGWDIELVEQLRENRRLLFPEDTDDPQ
uniref:Glycosyltransferase involved in cell wall bisynthesis n=1 Tax=Candidatus Kentrum sp. FW TaxID=2126338 RepID=A0A450SXU8_9GAMM|nr:MAG: Glycosyltransferase involved in cell wall bisynthesis [Candidatus Kentron sp. FW]VFJ58917.1 MAG: Glycosyltransferase involved in cell wall bisynthesis [Candidatus Kentron sp. FW]